MLEELAVHWNRKIRTSVYLVSYTEINARWVKDSKPYTCMVDTVKYYPDVSSVKDLLLHLLRVLSGDSLQMPASSVIASVAKSCLTQGHTPSQGSPHPVTDEKEGIYRPGYLSPTQKILKHHLSTRGTHEVG